MTENRTEIGIRDDASDGADHCAASPAPDLRNTPNLKLALIAAAGSSKRADILAMLGRPVTWCLVRHWVRGRAKMPAWAIAAVRARLSVLDAIVVASQSRERGDVGREHWRAYHARRVEATGDKASGTRS